MGIREGGGIRLKKLEGFFGTGGCPARGHLFYSPPERPVTGFHSLRSLRNVHGIAPSIIGYLCHVWWSFWGKRRFQRERFDLDTKQAYISIKKGEMQECHAAY